MTALDMMHMPGKAAARAVVPTEGFVIEDHYWGYVVRNLAPPPLSWVVAQVAALLGGLAMLALAVGVWLGPQAMSAATMGFHVASSSLFAILAVLLLWYASRGLMSEVHVDTRQGELREIIRRRGGKPVVQSRHGFDSITSVFIDRSRDRRASADHGTLMVRLGNGSNVLPVAEGDIAQLDPLCGRLSRDMMVCPRQAVQFPSGSAHR